MNDTPMRFDDQVAVVTGAGRGLGRAYAIQLASRGAAVVCNDITADAAHETVQTIVTTGGRAIVDVHSVASPESGAAIVQAALDTFGALDIVINNAGQLRNAAFDEMTADDFDDVVRTHLAGAFYVTQPAFRCMRDAGYGRIVFTSSGARFGSPWQANYAAAKAGIVGLCNVVALEGAAHGIVANAVMPMALTDIGRGGPPPFAPEELEATIRALRPLARHMTVENVAPLVLYLASRPCSSNGRVFSVGAGHLAEAFVGVTRGWHAPDHTIAMPEQVEAHLDIACDRTEFSVPASMRDEIHDITASMS
jgi:NAD(P)-dependent dehydrogenase (short-subunit alcohol dehydrogenase family)